ncbi:MAG: type II secretion system protein [Rubrivivax sp.]|nr:type II secretion system protein [Rubrivivax sp.]
MPSRLPSHARFGGRGFTLIDMLLVISLTGFVAGTLTVFFSGLAAQSSQALREREAAMLAHALLDEVRAMPFTYCDPQDARAAIATAAVVGGAGCATLIDALGPEPGETRYSPANGFDGVSDYHGFAMPGPGCASLCDRTGAPWPNGGRLTGCSASLAAAAQAMPALPALDANGRPQALRIVVTVRCPGSADVVAEGLRVRHAPNTF